MSTTETPVYEWKDLPWRTVTQRVFKLQKRIFQASRRGDQRTVHRLERLLMKSWAARVLAVRRVTQDNRGKNTAGVDGVKSLQAPQRLALVNDLRTTRKAQPVRRVWIPKPGKTERRPLGIPTIRDRAAQTLVRLALEPEWEARFEPNSYGFRPGRSVHDAIVAVHYAIKQKPMYVLDADIAGCFDNIDHTALLRKLDTFPALRRVIRGWLKAGVWDGVDFKPTESGTPQGGALSPLLANITLHGLENHIQAAFVTRRRIGDRQASWRPLVIRYADDFVVLHEDREIIEQTRHLAAQWLTTMGLELKPEKTRVCHTLKSDQLPVGFDFLGFTARQYSVSPSRSGQGNRGQRLGFLPLIKPSKQSQARHYRDLAEAIHRKRAAPQAAVIEDLNPKIIGWANFNSTQVSKQVFHRLDWQLWRLLWRWCVRRHPQQGRRWVKDRYWSKIRQRDWNFHDRKTGLVLRRHTQTPIVRHTKVRENASPYDGNLLYWAQRLHAHPELPDRVSRLLQAQKGRCAWCGLLFTAMAEVMEVDHKVPRSRGGLKMVHNRQLLHGHCHDAKTAADGSLPVVVWRCQE